MNIQTPQPPVNVINDLMDNLHVRITFNLGKTNKIFYDSYNGHPKISTIAKLGGEMLQNTENIAS